MHFCFLETGVCISVRLMTREKIRKTTLHCLSPLIFYVFLLKTVVVKILGYIKRSPGRLVKIQTVGPYRVCNSVGLEVGVQNLYSNKFSGDANVLIG